MSARLAFATVETPIGPMLLAGTDAGIAALTRDTSLGTFLAALRRRFPDAEPVADAPALRRPSAWLRAYLSGRRADLPVVDLRGLAAWDARVYQAVRTIPYGETATYGEVALAIGSAGAARAVGGSLSRCPLYPAVPCHRVVLAGDGVSGWGGGDVTVKRRLLDLERAGSSPIRMRDARPAPVHCPRSPIGEAPRGSS